MANPDLKADPQAFAPRVTFTSLNMDVLRRVMAFIPSNSDLLALMLTSHGFFALGRSELLRRPHCLYDSTIQSCHDSLTSTGPKRFGALRNLTFENILPARTSLVVEILQRASGLKELGMDTDLDDTICDAIVSMTTLQQLWLFNMCSQKARQKLAHVQSPLTTMIMPVSKHVWDPIPYFSNMRHTLEYISAENVDISSPGPYPCYPKVSRLELLGCMTPLLPPIMTAFPNLQHLGIECGGRGDEMWDFCEIQKANQEWQAQLVYQKAWQSLSVDLRCLDALSLQGTVQCLNITQAVPYFSGPGDEFTSWVHDELYRLKVQRLKLNVSDGLDGLADVFSVDLDRLTRIDLSVLFRGNDRNTPQQRLDDLFNAFRHLKHLQYLNLALFHKLYHNPPSWRKHAFVTEFLRLLDMPTLARRGMAASRTVTSIKLRVWGGKSQRTSQWEVLGSGEHRQLREVRTGQCALREPFDESGDEGTDFDFDSDSDSE